VYWTGISHPANENILAPAAKCLEKNGVLFVVSSTDIPPVKHMQ